MGKTHVRPSDLELQVLSVLWRRGPSTVRQVLEQMPDGKKRSYTTVLSVMQVMEGKRLLSHTREGRAHVYRPAVTRKRVLGPLLRSLVTKVFGGSTREAVQHLLDETGVDEDELARIRELLDSPGRSAARRQRQKG